MKGIRIGHFDTEAQIVGVVKDFHFQDLRHPMEPFAFYCSGETDGPGSSDSRYYRVAVKTVSGKADAVADRLPAILDRISGEEGAARATLLERTARSFYADNERESMLVQTSSILSLLLSLLGVFGLIYLEVQTIRKGVAIRKVMGASTGHLLWMMLRKYLLLGTAVFAAAVPLSLWIIGRWKQQFAEQAAVPAWIFLLAWVLVLGATAVVISSMALAVSRTAPAAELQKE